MRIRTYTTFLAAGLLVFTFGMGDAQAKKKKNKDSETELIEIEETGTSADEVFMSAKAIHDDLTEIDTKLAEGTAELVSALGLAEGTPLSDALADLNSKAGDALTVAMEGTTPKVSVDDAAPDNVKTAVNSLQSFVDYHVEALETAQGLVPKAQEVAAQAQALDPTSLAKEVASNPMEIPKVVKTVKSNVEAVGQTPGRVDSTVTTLSGNVDAVKGLAN